MAFVAERAALFQKLDGSFAALWKRSVQIPIYTQIRRNFKLSTHSVIHSTDEIIAIVLGMTFGGYLVLWSMLGAIMLSMVSLGDIEKIVFIDKQIAHSQKTFIR